MKSISVMKDGSFALGSPDYVNGIQFSSAGSTAHAITVPTTLGATHVFLSADCNFTARYNSTAGGTAAVYGSTITDGSACELNPTVRYLSKGAIAEISVISPTSGIVTASFYNSGST